MYLVFVQDLAAEKRLAKPESTFGYSDGRERKGPGRKGMKKTAADLSKCSFFRKSHFLFSFHQQIN
jgi:hypothetical protein